VIPSFSQSFTAFTTAVTGCGDVDYVLSPNHSFITIDPIALKIYVASTISFDIGTYTVTILGSLKDYP